MMFLIFNIVFLVIVIGVMIRYHYYYKRQELVRVRRDMVRAVNIAGDMDDKLDVLHIEATTVKLKKRLRYHGMPAIIKAIQYAEMKVGLLKKSEANKMVVDKIIRDYMSSSVTNGGLGMRNCDVVRNYNVAVTMYFLPRHQAVICDEVSKINANQYNEAKDFLGLDGSY